MILITGASGFIGGHLARALVAQGVRPRLLVRQSARLDVSLREACDIVIGDLSDAKALAAAAEGIEIVYHCAANVHTWDRPEAYEAANVAGTRNLLSALTAHAPALERVVYLSSVDVYGFPMTPADETAPTPITQFEYGNSKVRAEAVLLAWSEQHGTPYTILRPCNVIGPDSQFIDRIGSALKDGLMLLVNGGAVHGGFVYVDHLVTTMLWAAKADAAANQCFNVRDPYDATWADFVKEMRRHRPGKGLVISLPWPLALAVSHVFVAAWGLFSRGSEPLLHPLIVHMFGRTCGHRADKLYAASGIKPTVSFEQVMAVCLSPAGPQA